jgi:septal ring-binding cell division protein DamX
VTDTQIVLARPASRRSLALAAAAGTAVGIALGFVLAQFVAAPSPGGTAVAASVPAPGPLPASQAAAAAIPVASVSTAPPAPAAERPARGLTARIAAGRELLASGSQAYAVQLLVTDARDRAYLESYLADASRAVRPDDLYVVPAGPPESPRLALLLGSFDDRVEAFSALASLPEGLKQFRPYVRPLEAVRDDARRAERN